MLFFNISNNINIRASLKLLVYLGIRTYIAVLPRGLYYYNLLLLEVPFYLIIMAFYRVSMGFYFSYREI